MTSTFTYFFNVINTLGFTIGHSPNETLMNGDILQLTIPKNDTNQSVIALNIGKQYYYTLNNLNFALTPITVEGSKYSLVLQGYRNDYSLDPTNQILVIIPIMNTVQSSPAANIVTDIITNIADSPYNIPNGIDINTLIPIDDSSKFSMYSQTLNQINYQIVLFTKSSLYTSTTTNLESQNFVNLFTLPTKEDSAGVAINNNQSITVSTTTDDIYIDCKPITNKGENVRHYIDVNEKNSQLAGMNNFSQWLFNFMSFFVLILIVYIVYKLFDYMFKNKNTDTNTSTSTSTSTIVHP